MVSVEEYAAHGNVGHSPASDGLRARGAGPAAGVRVKEPRPTGSWWCVHYSIDWPSLRWTDLIAADHEGRGETFRRGTGVGDWAVAVPGRAGLLPGRVCAIKKSRHAAAKVPQHVRRQAQKHGTTVKAESLEAASYVFVFTTVKATLMSAAKVLEFYRGRWQIELVFKRLKSLLDLGHLREVDPAAARLWIQWEALGGLPRRGVTA